ncbi:right-handed parallel beta-helix repeat-containing protein [Phytoactinopolyspora halotolerans]|uniref:Right-handed parallel beta-helix repeat-containing protein n=1 Tax=Phytoactinopolyspora halotolerans TaxID=1981512 RepID=A0A6L9S483_9ACTN|nr:right-handed parallel beta-helix repeat-containing protein [Phytoactinopolyspora halotolerans]NED99610.1 right-handed parallel beta-helix repeat-containing protein [Phytoactinopolyspora halotolerans]
MSKTSDGGQAHAMRGLTSLVAVLLLAVPIGCAGGGANEDQNPGTPSDADGASGAASGGQSPATADASAFPDESTTGVTDESLLEQSEPVTSSRDSEVIENLEITGSIIVEHNNVTIRNVRVHGAGNYAIAVPHELSEEISGLVIEHSELIGVSGERSAGIAPFGSWTARHLDISAFEDGIKVGSNQTIENSWIHDLHTPPGSHSDGIQSTGGTNVTIRGNRIEGPWQGQTSAIIIQSNNGPVDTYTIENNLLSGGTYTLYLRDKGTGHGAPRNITVTNNTWTNNSWAYGPTSTDQGPNWTWNNNHTDTGTTID